MHWRIESMYDREGREDIIETVSTSETKMLSLLLFCSVDSPIAKTQYVLVVRWERKYISETNAGSRRLIHSIVHLPCGRRNGGFIETFACSAPHFFDGWEGGEKFLKGGMMMMRVSYRRKSMYKRKKTKKSRSSPPPGPPSKQKKKKKKYKSLTGKTTTTSHSPSTTMAR